MCGIAEDEASHGHVFDFVPGDAVGQCDLALGVFDEEGGDHREVGIGAHAVLVALSGAVALEIAAGLAHGVGRLALKPDRLGVLHRARQHLEQVLHHLGLGHEVVRDDALGELRHLRFGFGRIVGQTCEAEVVEGDLAASADPCDVGGYGDCRGFGEGEAHVDVLPGCCVHTACRAVVEGDGGVAEAFRAAFHLHGGATAAVGIEGFGLERERILSGGQRLGGCLGYGAGSVVPAHALEEGVLPVGDRRLAEVVVGEAVGGDEQLLVGARGGPARDGADVPSAQAVGRLTLADGVGAGSGVVLERGICDEFGSDVGLCHCGCCSQGCQCGSQYLCFYSHRQCFSVLWLQSYILFLYTVLRRQKKCQSKSYFSLFIFPFTLLLLPLRPLSPV